MELSIGTSNLSWDNNKDLHKLLSDIKNAKKIVISFESLTESFADLEAMMEFYKEGSVPKSDIDQDYLKLISTISKLEIIHFLNSESDSLSAIMEINAGAGGVESQDWVSMLLRMFTRWAESKSYSCNQVYCHLGDDAGIKSVSIEIIGEYAYGYLKSESGVHRLVRLSPFDSGNRRHTSFASVYVYPLVNDSIDISINTSDLVWDTFRSSGAGGQSVNKIESAVRVKHIPSGLVIECQEQRSQIKNRAKAIQLLKSKLHLLEVEKKNKEKEKIEKSKKKIEFGSQIRNYVFHPYKLVKDNRTNVETSDIQKVMDGEIDDFIEAYISLPK